VTNPQPRISEFAKDLEKNIHQIHSSRYLNTDSLQKGSVLVVGAGTSGVKLAIELAKNRCTYISVHPAFHIPYPVFRYA